MCEPDDGMEKKHTDDRCLNSLREAQRENAGGSVPLIEIVEAIGGNQ